MRTIIQIIGIVFVIIAIVYFLKPDALKHMMQFFKKGRRLYLAGLIRFALAVVFLLAAGDCRSTKVIAAFGILFIIAGLLIFTLGLERLKAILDWYQQQSPLIFRVIALIALAIGVIIIYAA